MSDEFQPSFSSGVATNFDNLIAGDAIPVWGESGTLLSGENRTRGALLGRVTVGSLTGAAVAGNTGNGTLGSITAGAGCKPGVYRIIVVEPGTNLGRFVVESPTGIIVGAGIVGTAFTGEINFTLSDGATDFVSGDSFTITVAAGSNKWKLSVAAATDGSEVPLGVLAGDMDASGGDKVVSIYRRGVFNQARLTYGAGHTAASVKEALLQRGIVLLAPGVAV